MTEQRPPSIDEDARRTLAELLDFASQGARLVARGKSAYDEDEMLGLAAEAILHRVGEAVARLGRQAPEVLDHHPEVSWRAMKATRNIVAHKYEVIDYQIIWNALVEDLPRESSRIRRILEDSGGDPDAS